MLRVATKRGTTVIYILGFGVLVYLSFPKQKMYLRLCSCPSDPKQQHQNFLSAHCFYPQSDPTQHFSCAYFPKLMPPGGSCAAVIYRTDCILHCNQSILQTFQNSALQKWKNSALRKCKSTRKRSKFGTKSGSSAQFSTATLRAKFPD